MSDSTALNGYCYAMQFLTTWLISERLRWVLWLPVLLASGAGLYYTLPREPSWWEMAAIPNLAIAIAFCYRRRNRAPRYMVSLITFSLITIIGCGTLLAYWHTERLSTIMVTKEVSMRPMEGQIRRLEQTDKGMRITFDQLSISDLPSHKTPQQIRLRLRGIDDILPSLKVGQRISFRAALMPPAGPVMPGGFDFARFFYFRHIGAVGYGTGPVEILSPAPESIWNNLSLHWQAMRERISQRITSRINSPAGAIAAALMIGDRAAIDDHSNQIMRETNLSHLLAISGLHMAMITGWVFALTRWGLLLPRRTRHLATIKEIAALAAIAAGLFYLLIADIPLSAARAYIMVLCIFGAILIHRQAAPMRSLAFAAMILLVYDPSNLLEPGFQLSFTATCALIAAYENLRNRWGMREIEYGIFMKAIFFFGATLLTTLVAELATAPLVAYHFGMVSLYGMLANLLVMPLVTFIIMPALVISFFLMPFGVEAPSFYVMEQGILAMLHIAQSVSEIPGASYRISGINSTNMIITIAGFFWLCLWQGKPRYFGAAIILLGLGVGMATTQHPQLLISHDAKQISAELENGKHYLVRGRNGYFISSQWAEGMGLERLEEIAEENGHYRCDALGCAINTHNTTIAFPYVKSALTKDCEAADIIIATFSISKENCNKPQFIIDHRLSKKEGGTWLWLSKNNAPKFGSTSRAQGERPWNRRVQDR